MVGLIIWQLIEYFLKIDRILSSEETNNLERFLSNMFAAYFFVIAEVEEYIIAPLNVLSCFKFFSSSLIIKSLTNHIGAKLTMNEFSHEKFKNVSSLCKSKNK